MSDKKEIIDEKESSNKKDQSGKKENNPFGRGPLPAGTPKPKFNIYWVYGLIIIIILGLQFLNFGDQKLKIKSSDLTNMIMAKDVDRLVVINKKYVDVYLRALTAEKAKKYFKKDLAAVPKTGPQCTMQIGSPETFERQVEDIQKDIPAGERLTVEYEERTDYTEFLGYLIWIGVFVVIWMLLFRRMGPSGGGGAGNIFNVGKSRAQVFDKDSNIKIDFKDVAGLEEAKIEIKEIVDFLKNPKKYTDLGGKIPKGALLVGPPGTGKTLLAKAVAGEANVPFFSMSGSDFVEMFVGVGASRVRDLFAQAKAKAPCIIFIDEIDAIGRARGRNPNMGANDERENTLNQLLTEMDGFATNTGVIILAATNRADILDRALLRAGRFDRQIHVELPDVNERKDIFKVHLRPLKTDDNLDIEFLSRQTPGFSGADIANVCNEAALIAARKSKTSVEKQDFLDAIDRIVGGLEKKNKIISPIEKKTIAYHEAGHATISWMLEHANPLVKVTIIPRGKALGAAWYLPEERQLTTTEQMLDEMCSALGGRAAEDVVLGAISTGALNDLERVTKQAYAMVAYFGMSKTIGNLSFYDSSGQSDYSFVKPYSEKTSEEIDKEVSELIASTYEKAKQLLIDNRIGLDSLANILLEKEVIFSEDLENIFGKRKYPNPHEHVLLTDGSAHTGVQVSAADDTATETTNNDEE
jgi:cell division protease FtsH